MSRIQFNAKEAKGFRTTWGKCANAFVEIDDCICKYNAKIKARNTLIATDNEDFLNVASGNTVGILRDADTIAKSLVENRQALETLMKERKTAMDTYTKRTEDAYAMLTDEMYDAYLAYANDGFKDNSAYCATIAEMFVANGIADATVDNVKAYAVVVGGKALKGKSAIKAEKHVSAMSKKAWRELFAKYLCDTLTAEGAITPKKWATTFETKNK